MARIFTRFNNTRAESVVVFLQAEALLRLSGPFLALSTVGIYGCRFLSLAYIPSVFNTLYMRSKESTSHIVTVFKIPFTVCSWEEILAGLEQKILNRSKCYISVTNTESSYYALKLPSHFDYISNAFFSCCDGIGMVLAGRLVGHRIPRLHGPDLLLKACEHGVTKGWRHFFLGGKEGVPQLLGRNIEAMFPGMLTAGTYSPPFRPLTIEEDSRVVDMINDSTPDILWVGLGLLKQERWIAQHRHCINAPLMIGVGAAFDFHAGTVRRAPRLFRDLGLEWLYRVVFEPRMIIRNLRGLPVIFMAAGQALRNRWSRSD